MPMRPGSLTGAAARAWALLWLAAWLAPGPACEGSSSQAPRARTPDKPQASSGEHPRGTARAGVDARPGPRADPRGRPGARPASTTAEGEFDIGADRDLAPRFPVVLGRTWQEVSYLGAAGDRIPALFRPARRPGRRPAVILGHGHGGDAEDMAAFFGPDLSRSVHVLSVTHPYHGRGRRQRGEDICPRDPERLVERWIRAVRDMRHALRVLGARPDVDPERIGYLGFSLGGCLGALLAAYEPRLRAAVLVAPAADWKTLAATDSSWHIGFGGQPLAEWLRVPRLASRLGVIDPVRSIARFAPRPLLVVVGKNDRVIRASSGRALYEAAGRGRELILHPGGHGPGGALRARIGRWLERKLGAEGR